MGIVFDSTIFIAGERTGQTARQILTDLAKRFPSEQTAISVVTLIELAHGAARADSVSRKTARWNFLNELMSALPIQPITVSIALRAGQIDGENAAKGIRLALSDLLIGVTALELGFAVASANLRHFQMVPGLRVVTV
jgi:tRNA(fMet)-specific endonuclease VapC